MTAPVPWGDRDALLDWTIEHFPNISPLMLERLLTHHGFVEVGRLPTTGSATAAMWAHTLRFARRELTNVRPVVYHVDVASEMSIKLVLQACELARQLGVHDARPSESPRSAS